MKNFKLLAFLFTILLIFNGCYKDVLDFEDREIIPPEVVENGNIEDFFEQVTSPLDSVGFDARDGLNMVTANNTYLQVFSNSFVDESGNLIEGEIDFRYLELLNPAEYAFYGLPTISDGQLLRTEGVFRFEAYHEGKAVKFKDGKGVVVRLPDDKPDDGMLLFYGNGEGEDFNWEITSDITGANGEIQITEWFTEIDSQQGTNIIEGFGYLFTCDLFQWINVDIFVDIPDNEKTKVCVELPEIYTPKNTVVFMFFNGQNSILGLYPDADEMKWCESYGATPIGYTVTLLVISNQGEDLFHFGIQEITVTEEPTIFIEPEEKSLEEITEIIKKLE